MLLRKFVSHDMCDLRINFLISGTDLGLTGCLHARAPQE